jgi:hypothetical protein
MSPVLVTPLLWHAINHPPTAHPLFWRTVRRSAGNIAYSAQTRMSLMDKLSVVYLVLFVGAMLLTNMLDIRIQSAGLAFLLLLLALPILLPVALVLRVTLLSGSFFGTQWAMTISQTLGREHLSGTFDLIALLPSGRLAGMWAICTGCLYRQHTFSHVLDVRMALLRTIMVGGVVVMAIEFLGNSNERFLEVVLLGIQILTALTALYIDSIHSTVLATLVGLIVPTYTLADTRPWAAGGFLILQVGVYTITLVTAAIILPSPVLWWEQVMKLAFILTVFFGVREIMIVVLWRQLLHNTNTDRADIACVFSFTRQ